MQRLTIKCTCGASYDIPESVVVDRAGQNDLAKHMKNRAKSRVNSEELFDECPTS